MKKVIVFIFFVLAHKLNVAQNQSNLVFNWQDYSLTGSWMYNNVYNECWGVEVNGSEIAIIGSTRGTHFFDITNPNNISEIAFVIGGDTGGVIIHRDYHDFQGYLYAVCDEGSSSTLQIIDLSSLPNSVNVIYDSNNLFTTSHNIFIDTATAKLYACASNNAMDIYSLDDPTNPTLIYEYNNVGHVHDAYVRNDTAFLNCGYEGLKIVDFNGLNNQNPSPPVELASFSGYVDAGYNHSGWLSDDGKIYAMQDENHGYDVKLLDVSDLSNISVKSHFNSGINSQSMAHNGIIKDSLLFIAYYHDGLRVFDISDPTSPSQISFYETYLCNDHSSYKGAWGVYPYFESGNIIVSDMQSGLFVLNNIIPSWNCINDECIDPGNGTGNYTSLNDCEIFCNIIPSWNCVNGKCIDPGNGNGIYSSLNNCQINCIKTTWNCISGECVENFNGLGNYASLNCCKSECSNTTHTNYDMSSINIFPNPAQNNFNIEIENNSVFQLFDIFGKKILNVNLKNGKNLINIEYIKSGIYLYKLLDNNDSNYTVGKLIKQ